MLDRVSPTTFVHYTCNSGNGTAPDAKKVAKEPLSLRGVTGNRTRDTRIFSPLLYQLSYDTIVWECKYMLIFPFCKIF